MAAVVVVAVAAVVVVGTVAMVVAGILSTVGVTLALVVAVVVAVVVEVVVGSAIIVVGVCTVAGVNALSAFTNTGAIDVIIPLKNPFTLAIRPDEVATAGVVVVVVVTAAAVVVGVTLLTVVVVAAVVVVVVEGVILSVVVGSAIIVVGVCMIAGVNALSAFTNTGAIDVITSSPLTKLDVISGSSAIAASTVVVLLLIEADKGNAALEDVITSSSPAGVSSLIIAEEDVGTSVVITVLLLPTTDAAIDFSGGFVVVEDFAVTGNTATAPTSNACSTFSNPKPLPPKSDVAAGGLAGKALSFPSSTVFGIPGTFTGDDIRGPESLPSSSNFVVTIDNNDGPLI